MEGAEEPLVAGMGDVAVGDMANLGFRSRGEE